MDFFSWILINLKWIILFFVALLMLASGMYSLSQKSEVCPMPYALCPMPYPHEYLIFLRKAILVSFFWLVWVFVDFVFVVGLDVVWWRMKNIQ